MHRRAVAAAIILALAAWGWTLPLSAATAFADPRFQAEWQRDEAIVPNFWGPLATASERRNEPYGDPRATGSNRLVQYFDKGRMEVGDHGVTSGLLATELITGQIQTGDALFEPEAPPAIPVAGDPDNLAPTYAGLASRGAALLQPAASAPNGFALATVAVDGTVTSGGAGLPSPESLVAAYDPPTRHNVAQAFAAYRDRAGLATIGYAISEPFLTTVKVGGVRKEVMVQIFERRVLTYTSANDPAFRVEMGNIGLHYYQWRYAPATPAATTATPAAQNGGTTPVRPGVPPATAQTCPIIYPVKGFAQAGARWYDTPGSATYAGTKPESCFVSPTDAEAAGYRAIQR